MSETKIGFVSVVDHKNVDDIDILKDNFAKRTHPFLYPAARIERGGYVILDFGSELVGRLCVAFGYNEQGGKIRIRLGESVCEACAELGERNAGNNHSLRDNEYHAFTWGELSSSESGFRFARIDNIGDVPIDVLSVFAYRNDNGLPFKGDFSCSDARLNSIYETARKTISLCVRDGDIWDGVKRDRVFWMGDFYPELVASYFVYGDIPEMKACLEKISYFTSCWANNIPSYSAWWIICLEEYYRMSLDKGFLREMLCYVERILKEFSVIVLPNGSISYKDSTLSYFGGNEFFIDWPTNLTEDAETGFRYVLLLMLEKTKRIYSLFGKDDSLVDELVDRLDRYGYKPSRFKQVTALGVLAGRIGKEEAISLLEEGGYRGMTCFMGLFIIEALREAGEGAFALDLIKEYYGKMIDLGATTFFEDFDLDWLKDDPTPLSALPDAKRKNIHADYGKFCYLGLRHSLCHGWSSGFIRFFYSHILGINEVEPGFRKIRVDPHLEGLSFAKGSMPTPFGPINVEHRLERGKLVTKLDLPKGVRIAK